MRLYARSARRSLVNENTTRPSLAKAGFYSAHIFLAVFFSTHVSAQKKVDASFRIFGHTGKKINDSTTLNSNGVKAFYSPSRQSVTVVYPKGTDPMQRVRDALNKSDSIKLKVDQVIVGSPQDPRPAGMVVEANKGIDKADASISPILKTTVSLDDPSVGNLLNQPPMTKTELPAECRAYYNEVMSYVNNPDPGSSSNIPTPPTYYFDYCFPCDEARRSAYSRDSATFIDNLFKEERVYIDKASSVLSYLQKQKPKSDEDSIFIFKIRNDLYDAIKVIVQRMEKKILGVWLTYQHDHTKIPFLVARILDMDRQLGIMGIERLPGFPTAEILGSKLAEMVTLVIQKAKQEKDFTVLLNVGGIMYVLKLAQVLGLNTETLASQVIDFMGVNQFKITIDPEAKISNEEMAQLARLHFETTFDAYPDSTCKLMWLPHGHENIEGLVFDLKNIAMTTPSGAAIYTGVKQFGAKRPFIKLDFCEEKNDTAFFFSFFPYAGRETWSMGELKDYPLPMLSNLFMICFMNEAEMRKAAAQNPQALINEMNTSYQKVKANMGNLNINPATMKPEDYVRLDQIIRAAEDTKNALLKSSLYYFPVKGKLKNNQNVIFDETLDGRTRSNLPHIDFANFKVKIEWLVGN